MNPYGEVVAPCPLAAEPKKTWIEIELVGENDLPVPNVAYRILAADGSVREGKLDSDGFAREDNLNPGNCIVTFPELDRDAWEGI